jgi:hypothetical protein
MARIAATVRISTRKTAVWRHCVRCDALAPLAPKQTHCRDCHASARTAGRLAA